MGQLYSDRELAAQLIQSVGTDYSQSKAANEFENWGYEPDHALKLAKEYQHLVDKVYTFLETITSIQ